MIKEFIKKADLCLPELYETKKIISGQDRVLNQGESCTYDFGNHYTGKLEIKVSSKGSHQDAPVFVKFKFCEVQSEIDEDVKDYHGWISSSWIQEEYLHIDELPAEIELPRRYAFRYVKIQVLGMSSKHSLVINELCAKATSCANLNAPSAKAINQIDKVALRTLSECMQKEFEDGPKRDRRLWIGDLRLQALTNYETYKNYDLVKRCLYLFAGTSNKEGRVSACVFTSPKVEADDTYMFDYSLFFPCILLDYYNATRDTDTLSELYPTALRQIELCGELNYFDNNSVIRDRDELGWCFLDWNLALNKQAGAQAIYIYAVKKCLKIAEILKKDTNFLKNEAENKTQAAISAFFDEKKGLFVSGKNRQISYAVNVWFCLAQVFDKEKNQQILQKLTESEEALKPVTPYMYHHYIQALIDAEEKDKAFQLMNSYWGGMVNSGADTFYELYNPENPEESPYGAAAVNSYCHAWSCTPAYFLRKYFYDYK